MRAGAFVFRKTRVFRLFSLWKKKRRESVAGCLACGRSRARTRWRRRRCCLQFQRTSATRSLFFPLAKRQTHDASPVSLSLSLSPVRASTDSDVGCRVADSIVMIPFHTFRDRIPFLTCQRLATRDPFLLKESWRTLHGSLCDAGDGAVVVQRVLGRRRVSENPSGI